MDQQIIKLFACYRRHCIYTIFLPSIMDTLRHQ